MAPKRTHALNKSRVGQPQASYICNERCCTIIRCNDRVPIWALRRIIWIFRYRLPKVLPMKVHYCYFSPIREQRKPGWLSRSQSCLETATMPLWNVLPTVSSMHSGRSRGGHARPNGTGCALNLFSFLMISAYLTVLTVVSPTTSATRWANEYFQIKTACTIQRLPEMVWTRDPEHSNTHTLDHDLAGCQLLKANCSGLQS
jgi:hypothetical protein